MSKGVLTKNKHKVRRVARAKDTKGSSLELPSVYLLSCSPCEVCGVEKSFAALTKDQHKEDGVPRKSTKE